MKNQFVKFRFLTIVARQLGYHFAKVFTDGLAGDPEHHPFFVFGAKLFGGAFNYIVIDD